MIVVDTNQLKELTATELRQYRAKIHKLLHESDSVSEGSTPGAAEVNEGLHQELDAVQRELRIKEGKLSEEAAAAWKADRAKNGDGKVEYTTAEALLRPDQSVRSYLANNGLIKQGEFEKLSLGAVMRSMVLGPRNELERRALAEGSDSTGGVSVPVDTLTRFIDRLRSATVAIKAGAQTLVLETDTTIVARTTADPVCAWRLEAGAVAESDPAFEALTFTPRSLAVYFKISRELLEDSVNIESALEASLVGALSVELDRVALRGSGTAPEPRGIINTTNVGSVASGGALTSWDKFIDSVYELWVDNAGDPTAIVMHPRTLQTIAKFKEATTNAPLAKPPVLANVPILRTTGLSITETPGTASTAIIGDFTQLIIAIRTNLRIEILRELFAQNLQYAFLAHLRADIGLQHPESFCKLTGIVP